jgi:hypothetical protein
LPDLQVTVVVFVGQPADSNQAAAFRCEIRRLLVSSGAAALPICIRVDAVGTLDDRLRTELKSARSATTPIAISAPTRPSAII